MAPRITSPLNATVKVVRDASQPGGVSLGCSVAEFQADGGVAGKIAVVQRGVCARVAKAIYGQQAGAAAVIMVNNSTVAAAVRKRDLPEPRYGRRSTT